LSEEEFELRCADCTPNCDPDTDADTEDDWQLGYCEGSMGYCNADICREDLDIWRMPVKRCQCEPGFMGPLCNVHPVEGTVTLYLDHSDTGVCGVCGDNFWEPLTLDGLNKTCITFPKEQPLQFQAEDGSIIFRQVAVTLNLTHYSVLVGSNGANDMCENQEKQRVVHTFLRNSSQEQMSLDYAVYLNKTSDFLGEVVDPGGVDCKVQGSIDQSVCESTELIGVYTDAGKSESLLKKAWVHMQLKVTPVNDV
jgi:hypothetical protein